MQVRISQPVEVIEGYYKGVRGRVTALYMDSNRVEITYPHPEAGNGKVNPGHEVRCDVWSSQLAPIDKVAAMREP